MTGSPDPTDIERFRGQIARHLGLNFDDTRVGFLAETFRARVDATELGKESYLARLGAPQTNPREWRVLADELTVPETYFFRNSDQLRALKDVALPDRLRARAAHRTLRIFSAGCASGEEAYSLAIIVREALTAASGFRFAISAVDVSPRILERARQGLYSSWALRETPVEVKQKWFRASGRNFALDDEIVHTVTFTELNLIADDDACWKPDSFDIIFCRNVMMYFTPEHARGLVGRLERALTPGGFLFLGHAETLRGLSQNFHLRHTNGTFYYQRRDSTAETAQSLKWGLAVSAPAVSVPLTTIVDNASSWVDAIRQASERIQALSEPSPAPGSVSAEVDPHDSTSLAQHVGKAVDLLRRERFGEALAVITGVPSAWSKDPEVLLLRAVLLTHSGDLVRAQETCVELLAVDELNAGAHYLAALCREAAKDRQGAVEHDQAAAYLDAGFAMPRLHLGLLARRAGQAAKARNELSQALVLLQCEDSSRLLLFGGGFSREALVTLCRAELAVVGESS